MRRAGQGPTAAAAVALMGLASLIAGGSASATSFRASATRICGPAAKTLVANDHARVYELTRSSQDWLILGCVPGYKPRRLDVPRQANTPWEGKSTPWLNAESMALNGDWVGYSENFVNVDVGDMQAAALNLRTGSARYCDFGSWSSVAGVWFRMTGIVITEKGSVGWIGDQQETGNSVHEVGVCEGTRRRVLDQGGAIALHSLRLHGHNLSWTDRGISRTVQLR